MATVCLDKQVFYNPPGAAGPGPASRGLLVRKEDPSPPPPPSQQDAHNSRHGDAGNSEDSAILIPSDSESDDDLDDGRSDTSFASLEELVAATSKELKSSGIAGAGESLDTVPNDSDVPEPLVTRPSLDDEFADEQQQRGSLRPSPEPLSGSPETPYTTRTQPIPSGCAAFETGRTSAPNNTLRDTTVPETDAASLAEYSATRHGHGMQHNPRSSEKSCGTTSNHNGSICLDDEEWDRRFPFSSQALRRRRAAKSAYNPAEPDQSQSMLNPHCQPQSQRLAASGFEFATQLRSDGHCPSQHRDRRGDSSQTSNPEHHHLVPGDREQQNGMCPAAPPQMVESQARTPTLPDDESTSELEPADAEPHLPPQSPCSAASGHGVDPQQRSSSCRLSQHRDHRSDSVQTSDPEYRHPLIPDDRGEQDEESSVELPQAQESRAGMPSLSGDESGNERGLANTKPSMQPSASQERATLRHNVGCRRRRRRCDTDDEEDCSPIVESDAGQGKDEDPVQPPRGKRRKVNTSASSTRRTAPKRQAHLRNNSLSLQAQQPPTQGPKCRQSQRRISKPQSSRASALEEETLEAASASFEEWPLEAVLKRVWVDEAATFQVEFTWNPCTNHGQNDRVPENPRRKSPVGRISSTARALPSRVASTTKKVQGDEYFNVEEILEWRQGEEGLEYLVKWAGYGKKHNSWEPAAHFEQCPEILEQFHQEEGLPPP